MNKEFWKAVAIRALHTACQSAIGAIGATALASEVNWVIVIDTVALATITSVLKSITLGMPEVD